MRSARKKLLAATVIGSLDHLKVAYGDHAELACVVRLDDALAALDAGVCSGLMSPDTSIGG